MWWQKWNIKSDNKRIQQSGTKGKYESKWMGEKGDPLWIVPDSKIYPCWQMLNAQTRICTENKTGILRYKRIT